MSSKTSKNRRIGNGNAHVCALPRASLDFCSANRAHCSNGGAVMATAQTLSFRGANITVAIGNNITHALRAYHCPRRNNIPNFVSTPKQLPNAKEASEWQP